MMRHEFEEILGSKVTDDEWEKVEMVYTWYEEKAKKADMAVLYKIFGIKIFYDCYQRAKKISELNGQLSIIKAQIAALMDGSEQCGEDQPIQYWPTEKSGKEEDNASSRI